MFRSPALKSALIVFSSLAFSACIDMSALKGDLKAQVDQNGAKTVELQKAVTELNAQVRALNEENNSVKTLVSKVSDHVLAQQNKIEELEVQLKAIQTQPKSFSGGSSKSKKR